MLLQARQTAHQLSIILDLELKSFHVNEMWDTLSRQITAIARSAYEVVSVIMP